MTQPDPWAGFPQQYSRSRADETDGVAIAALIVGLLPFCVGIPGIVLGIVAVNRTARNGTKGRGLAFAGIAAGVLWIVVLGVIGATGAFDRSPERSSFDGSLLKAGTVRLTDLRIGDCLPAFNEGSARTVKVVPCSEAHTAEVYDTFELEPRPYPGDNAVVQEIKGRCESTVGDYANTAHGVSPDYELLYFRPVEKNWDIDRKGTCLLGDDHPLYGSAHNQGRNPNAPKITLPGESNATVPFASVVVGNCTSDPVAKLTSPISLTPCAGKHTGEFFLDFQQPAGPFPGAGRAEHIVEERCTAALPRFVGAKPGATGYTFFYFFPRQKDWLAGDRRGLCVLADPHDRPLVGDAKGKGRHH